MKIVLIIILTFSPFLFYAQSGSLKGKITDKDTKEPLSYASVVVEAGGKQYGGTMSDEKGYYIIKPIPPGKYNLRVTHKGYIIYLLKNIKINEDELTSINIQLNSSVKNSDSIEIKEYKNREKYYQGFTAKPAIYLYPATTQEINVKLDFKGKIENTYPEYNQGWSVKAEPGGRLLNIKDNRVYNYLFWDGVYTFPKEHFDYKSGFIVKKQGIVSFLQEKLSYIGLNQTEINDFIVYWLPQLNKNEASLVHFWINDNIDNSAFLNIVPKPDTEIRVFMEFKKAEANQSIPKQNLPKIYRKGFTLVEWGGSDLNTNKIE